MSIKIEKTQSEEKEIPKEIDIYQHMKSNLREFGFECECPGSPSLYCIPCKTNVCKNCNYEEHKTHFIVSKENTSLSPDEVKEVFDPLVKELSTKEIFLDCKELKNKLIKNIEAFTKEFYQKIENMKQKKIEEFNKIFNDLESNIAVIHNQIKDTKDQINNYYNKYKKFFLYNNDSSPDETNFVFLMNFDIINIIKRKTGVIQAIGKNLETDIKNIASVENYKYNLLLNNIDKAIKLSNKDFYDSIEEDYKDKNIKITNEIRRDYSHNQETYVPYDHFAYISKQLNEDHFKEITSRITAYSENIESFKSKVFSSFQKTRNYKGIENEITMYENLKKKGSETFFTKRSPTSNITSNYATQRSKAGNTIVNSHISNKYNINSKEDICLNDPILRKFFAFQTLDLYGDNFKTNTKEFQSSHTDLLLKVDTTIDNDQENAKVIEGTNIINIYDKKNQKFIKKKIPLCRNPFGYSNFPIGCRCIVLGDKVYVTGGKDEQKEYAVVLVYNVKTQNLKRIMDLNVPRSYHTIIYNDVFKTIMIFGGENEYTCEVFDPLCNRWLFIPPLNFSRANPFYHFDKPRGLIYALFGMEGKILNGHYSDVIEYLDLGDLRKGWTKLEYYNKSQLSLKNFINILPLNNELLLGYGGEMARDHKRLACSINLTKGEVTRIGKDLRTQLQIESRKNLKLNYIVSSLNLK